MDVSLCETAVSQLLGLGRSKGLAHCAVHHGCEMRPERLISSKDSLLAATVRRSLPRIARAPSSRWLSCVRGCTGPRAGELCWLGALCTLGRHRALLGVKES